MTDKGVTGRALKVERHQHYVVCGHCSAAIKREDVDQAWYFNYDWFCSEDCARNGAWELAGPSQRSADYLPDDCVGCRDA